MQDPIAVVETAYRPADSTKAWLEQVVHEVAPRLPPGVGVAGLVFDRHAPGPNPVREVVGTGALGSHVQAYAGLYATMSHRHRRILLSGSPAIASLSSLIANNRGMSLDAIGIADAAPGFAFVDSVALCASDPSGAGCVVGTAVHRPAHVSRHETALWTRIAAHVAAGLRIQSAATQLPCEAILCPDGRVEDASGAARTRGAREALRNAVRFIDGARSARGRREPARALAAWLPLVDGRWSLIDRFESDGRRYMVALENPPLSPDPRGLTRCEQLVASYVALGHPNKVVAYSLGMAEGTVAAHLSRALRKLGVRSRAQLVSLWMDWESDDVTIERLRVLDVELLVLARQRATPRSGELTELEMRVASAAASGRSTREIATELNRSPHTISNTLVRIFRKLQVGSRSELSRRLCAH